MFMYTTVGQVNENFLLAAQMYKKVNKITIKQHQPALTPLRNLWAA